MYWEGIDMPKKLNGRRKEKRTLVFGERPGQQLGMFEKEGYYKAELPMEVKPVEASWAFKKRRLGSTNQIMTYPLLNQLPPLYATDAIPLDEKRAIVKYFTPSGAWTWIGFEYDRATNDMFGAVMSPDTYGRWELGYFNLDQLAQARGAFGPAVERDIFFRPMRFGDLKKGSEYA